jgi:RNA polymerase sigma factor (sigma-70 family)
LNAAEQHIIDGCKKGDRKAQEELYRKYKGPLFGICLRYARDYQEAEDILQEGFIAVYRDLYQYRPTGSFNGWLRRVVVNTALQHIRRSKKLFPVIDIHGIADNQESNEDFFAALHAKALIQMVQQLPDGYRAVFNLYVIEGYSHAEIAKMLEINESTSKSQLSRAKAVLRQMVERVIQ